MKDGRGYRNFKAQIDVIDIMWLDDETGIALCDDGSDDDVLYLIKDKVPFEFYKLMDKKLFVNIFNSICEQLGEKMKRDKYEN